MIQKFNSELTSGVLLASVPQSASTHTADKLSTIGNMRVENIARTMDPYGVREQDFDIKKLEGALRLNKNSSFIARQHMVCTNLILRLIKRKFLVPLVLTRNLPDVLVSLVDQHSLPNLDKDKVLFPKTLVSYDIESKCDYFIHFEIPWHLKFFTSWLRYDEFSKVWLRFEDFKENNQAYFDNITSILEIEKIDVESLHPRAIVSDDVTSKIRINRGMKGRGRKILNSRQIGLIEKMIELVGIPNEYRNYLLTGNI